VGGIHIISLSKQEVAPSVGYRSKMNTLSRLPGRLSRPRTPLLRQGLAYEVAGTISEAGAEARSWGTLRHQNELPKMVWFCRRTQNVQVRRL